MLLGEATGWAVSQEEGSRGQVPPVDLLLPLAPNSEQLLSQIGPGLQPLFNLHDGESSAKGEDYGSNCRLPFRFTRGGPKV